MSINGVRRTPATTSGTGEAASPAAAREGRKPDVMPTPSSSILCGLAPRRPPPKPNPRQNQVTSPAARHLGQLDGKGNFVATGNWHGPDQQEGAVPSRTAPLQDHEYQQAAYQLGARLNGSAVEDPAERRYLAEATATMHQTRTDLKFGRGNIADDVHESKGESAVRAAAAYEMSRTLGHGADTEAGVSLALKAGNCDHHAAINARRHAPKIEAGGTTHMVGADQYHHSYALYNPPPKMLPGGAQEGRPTIVLDSWANGPAVRLQDSTWTSGLQSTSVSATFDKESGSAANAAMEQARAEATYPGFFAKRTTLYAQSRSQVAKYRKDPPKFQQFSPSALVDPAFASAARQNLLATGTKPQGELAQEILAVGAARQSYNLSVAEATKPETIEHVLNDTADLSARRPPRSSR